MKKKLLIIFSLLILCLSFGSVCFASVEFSSGELQSVINHFKNSDYNCFYANKHASGDFPLLNDILNNISFSEFSTRLNQSINNFETTNNLSFDKSDFSCYFVRGFYAATVESDAKTRLSLSFIINPNNNLKFYYDTNYNWTTFNSQDNNLPVYYIPVIFTYKVNQSTQITIDSIRADNNYIPNVKPNYTPVVNQLTNEIELPFYLAFSNNNQVFYNNESYSVSNFFQEAPQVEIQEGSLAEIVTQVENKDQVLQEIVGLLPIILVVIVALIALRKALQLLETFFHRS